MVRIKKKYLICLIHFAYIKQMCRFQGLIYTKWLSEMNNGWPTQELIVT